MGCVSGPAASQSAAPTCVRRSAIAASQKPHPSQCDGTQGSPLAPHLLPCSPAPRASSPRANPTPTSAHPGLRRGRPAQLPPPPPLLAAARRAATRRAQQGPRPPAPHAQRAQCAHRAPAPAAAPLRRRGEPQGRRGSSKAQEQQIEVCPAHAWLQHGLGVWGAALTCTATSHAVPATP